MKIFQNVFPSAPLIHLLNGASVSLHDGSACQYPTEIWNSNLSDPQSCTSLQSSLFSALRLLRGSHEFEQDLPRRVPTLFERRSLHHLMLFWHRALSDFFPPVWGHLEWTCLMRRREYFYMILKRYHRANVQKPRLLSNNIHLKTNQTQCRDAADENTC